MTNPTTRRRRGSVSILLALALLALPASPLLAQGCEFPPDYTVDDEGSLGAAIDCFNDQVQEGRYLITLTDDIDLEALLPEIENDIPGVHLHIDGQGHTIDGQGIADVRHFTIRDAEVTVEDITLTGGHIVTEPDDGGSIHNDGGTLALVNARFVDNIGRSRGGAIYNTGATVTVIDSTFADNRPDTLHSEEETTAVVVGSTFTTTYIVGNFGSLIFHRLGGRLTVADSTFVGASAATGIGFFTTSPASIINSTFVDLGRLEGIVTNSSQHVTFLNNTFSSSGLGVWHGNVTLMNSIFANSHCSDAGGLTYGHNLFDTDTAARSCRILNGDNGDLIGVDPLLDPAGLADHGGATHTIALLEGSPAIDAGNGSVCADPGTVDGRDQRGVTRPQGAGCDIGAYEWEWPDLTPPIVVADVQGALGEGDWYVSDVDVSWSVTDDESEIIHTEGCDPTTIDADTADTTLVCVATSQGGTTTEGVVIRRDAAAPVVAVTGVSDGAVYPLGAVPVASCDTEDATSGVAVAATAHVTGGQPDGTGDFTATCDGAIDNAGNTATAVAVSYVVEADDAPDAWDPSVIYNTGDRVTHGGKVYEALWWTWNQEPGTSPWGPWQEMAETEDGIAIWTDSRVFGVGDIVIHDGKTYRALWWTRNQTPGDPSGPWEEIAETEDGIPIWTPSRIFDAGKTAVHDGVAYVSLWWTRNQVPGVPWGPWQPA